MLYIHINSILPRNIPTLNEETERGPRDCKWGDKHMLPPHSIFKKVFIFGHGGSSLLCGLFSSCGEWGLLSSCGGFSCCRAQALECEGFSSCSTRALEHRLNNCGAWA